jgi:hypothetical protein
MPWIKRNLFLVVGGLIALGLLGVAGYFLYTKIQLNEEVSAQLDASTTKLKDLVNRDPHPGTPAMDNIGTAKKELQKLQTFLGDVRHYFPPARTNQLSDREFRALLDNTINDLKRNAERSGVELASKDYWFTFAAQKSSFSFGQGVVSPLTTQLAEIRALCNILYDAKVISLNSIKRAPIASEDSGYTDYLTTKAQTNELAVVMPYEVTFQSFSSELASVLEGLIRSTNCFVVRNVAVEKSGDTPGADAINPYGPNPYGPSPYSDPYRRTPYPGNPYGPRGGGMDPSLQRRYGLAPTPPPTSAPAPRTSRGGLTTVLDEKPLKVVLSLESVRVKTAK